MTNLLDISIKTNQKTKTPYSYVDYFESENKSSDIPFPTRIS